MISLQLDHEALGSNRGLFVPFAPESNATPKALKLSPFKNQISLVPNGGCSVRK